MGKLFKFLLMVISILVLLFIIVGAFNGVWNIGNRTHPLQQHSPSMPGKKEYNNIRVGNPQTGEGGMTLSEVEQILGKHSSQTEGTNGKVKMVIYTFAAQAGPNSILVTFINGHVSGKTQTGLK